MVRVCVAGAINWDINLFVERFPKIGEEVSVHKITRIPGGKAANVAVAVTRILGDGETALIGCLGRDSIAEQQIEILKNEGVVIEGIKFIDEAESGQAYIIIDGEGRNMINTLFGANMDLLPQDLLQPDIGKLLSESSFVVFIDPPLETIEKAVSLARSLRKIVVWDAGTRSSLGAERLTKVLEGLDYLFVNQIEVENITGEQEPQRAWARLSNINKNMKLVLKLGEKGCVFVGPRETIEIPAVNLEEMNQRVINTVGCGDAFLGAFIAVKCEKGSDRKALEIANLAGALKATRTETRGSPKREDIEKCLRFISTAKSIKRNN